MCQADFYAGLKHLVAGDKTGRRGLFPKICRDQPKRLFGIFQRGGGVEVPEFGGEMTTGMNARSNGSPPLRSW